MMEKPSPLVITLAPTGIVPSRDQAPHLPITPAEIAADVEQCFSAGARVFHLHARSEDGEATCRREVFAEIVGRVKQAVPQAIVCVSTSGRRFPSYQDRSEVLDLEGELKPDLASLTPGSMNFPRETSINSPSGLVSSTWASGPMAITRRILAGSPLPGALAGSRSNSCGRTKPTACSVASWP